VYSDSDSEERIAGLAIRKGWRRVDMERIMVCERRGQVDRSDDMESITTELVKIIS